MKRSLTERVLRKFPWHRKELLRKAKIRKYIKKLERKSMKLAIDLRTAPQDQIQGMVMEIGMISWAITMQEQKL